MRFLQQKFHKTNFWARLGHHILVCSIKYLRSQNLKPQYEECRSLDRTVLYSIARALYGNLFELTVFIRIVYSCAEQKNPLTCDIDSILEDTYSSVSAFYGGTHCRKSPKGPLPLPNMDSLLFIQMRPLVRKLLNCYTFVNMGPAPEHICLKVL